MVPVVQSSGADRIVDIADLKSENNVVSYVKLAHPPVADKFMYDFKYKNEHSKIVTLGVDIPADCNARKEAESIVTSSPRLWDREMCKDPLTSSLTMGYYMEWYALSMELNVWCKSTVVKAERDAKGTWTVIVKKGGKETCEVWQPP
ncbi:hypothetical protein BD289DRAFT_454381 [Coniella lustricola]|uniref:Uncharacterized protein n=1 Tax=Coniella lustricola TaxID=2025994 RepID=A0A2T3A3P0_9PEZI|nr:hypothetical protein BD289DRAFT_454381 [Coniella lustricola]